MSDADDFVERYWREALASLSRRGWRISEHRLQTQVREASTLGRASSETAAALLVLGSLQQKFGQLDDARSSLSEGLASVEDLGLRVQLEGTLAKVLSQAGDFDGAKALLERIIQTKPQALVHPTNYWRHGLASVMRGDMPLARQSFARHRDMVYGEHPSQEANNLVFSSSIGLAEGISLGENVLPIQAAAFKRFISSTLETGSVKFVDVAKSAVLPMYLASAALIRLGLVYPGLVQSFIVRLLMNDSELGLNSEGISEMTALGRTFLGDNTATTLLLNVDSGLDSYLAGASSLLTHDRVGSAWEEAQARFSTHQVTGNFGILWVDHGLSSVALQGRERTTLYYSVSFDPLISTSLRLYAVERLQLQIIDQDDSTLCAIPLVDRAEAISRSALLAVVDMVGDNQLLAGALASRLGRERCLVLGLDGNTDELFQLTSRLEAMVRRLRVDAD